MITIEEIVETRPNELHPEFTNTNVVALFLELMSSSRVQMRASQATQTLPTRNCTDRICFTGGEAIFADYSFGTKMPHDGHVLKVITRHPVPSHMADGELAAETFIFYEYDKETPEGLIKEVSYISYKSHFEAHQQFGFKQKLRMKEIEDYIPKGTIITSSPTISDDGNWRYGVETNVAMMSVAHVVEDGIVASKEWCDETVSECVETYVVSVGKKQFPLNLRGDLNTYKPFLDVGEIVPEDGILFASRKYSDDFAPITMSRKSCMTIDHRYDRLIRVEPGARIVDIRVHHDTRFDGNVRGKNPNTPVGMTEQLQYYYDKEVEFYTDVLSFYRNLNRSTSISRKMHMLVVQAMGLVRGGDEDRFVRTYRNANIDEWRIEITIAYETRPGVASKLSGTSGNKGVIVKVIPREDMPVDKHGNRADLIVDGLSMVKRMIMSSPMETFLTAAARDVTKKVIMMMDANYPHKEVSDYLAGFYNIVNPQIMDILADDNNLIPMDHLLSVVKRGVHLWVPVNNQPEPINILHNVIKHYPPVYGPVTYRGSSGNIVETVKPVLIGSMYIMVLEKTGDDWTGVASSKLNNFGVPGKITSSDRFSGPARNQSIRFGEAEARLFVATVGPRETADLFNRTNNPLVRRQIQEAIFRTKTPTALEPITQSENYSRGNGRIHALVKCLGACAGWSFQRIDSDGVIHE